MAHLASQHLTDYVAAQTSRAARHYTTTRRRNGGMVGNRDVDGHSEQSLHKPEISVRDLSISDSNTMIQDQSMSTPIVEQSASDDTSSTSIPPPAETSLLTLPYEIRSQILQLVLQSQPFLSSRQQVAASFPAPPPAPPTTATQSNDSTNTDSAGADHVLSGKTTITIFSSKKQPYKARSYHHRSPAPAPSPFTHHSSSFRQYAETRLAETSILYVNRQLRREGLRFWYAQSYYMTLVLETPRRQITSPSSSSTGRAEVEPALRFDEADQVGFWARVAAELRFPSWDVLSKWKKFHVTLFIEEYAFAGLRRDVGVSEGLKVETILEILMGKGKEDEGSGGDGESEEVVKRKMRFKDHTFLGIARDAADESVPVPVDLHTAGKDEDRYCLTVELWKT